MWPVHTWLPDAHVEAPTGGSVILAAIMLKMGGYGFLRFSLPITPDASRELDWLIIGLSLIAIAYIGFVALVQQDMKKLIAYSSIAHMGFVTLGCFLAFAIVDNTGSTRGAAMGLDGAMVQMISHGLVSGALFLCVGVLYDRLHTRDITPTAASSTPCRCSPSSWCCSRWRTPGCRAPPASSASSWSSSPASRRNFWYAFIAATTLILGAAYTLWLVKRVVWGEVGNDGVASLKDVNRREFAVLAVLAVAVLRSACGLRRCST
jgi:NADH-quinone oxidoreductase subunit M